MAIGLPGYKTVFENRVFAREIEARTVEDKSITITTVVLPMRYLVPTKDQVVAHLQQKSQEVEAAASIQLLSNVESVNRSPLEAALISLSRQVRSDIRNGNEQCLEYLRNNTSASQNGTQLQYVHIRYGLLLPTIPETEQGTVISGPEWYDTVLSLDQLRERGLGERWTAKILLEDGRLPDKAEMDVLLKHSTASSKTLAVSMSGYPIDIVKGVVDALYQALPTPEAVADLTDNSAEVLDQYALQPVNALQQSAILSQLRRSKGQ